MGVLRLAGRRQLRLFLRRGRVRPVHLLPGLPAPGPVHHRATGCACRRSCCASCNGIGVDYTTRVTESMLARVHFIVRTDPANPPGEIDADALAEQLADATRLLGRRLPRWCWSASSATSRPSSCSRGTPTRCPRRYKDGHTPYEAVQDLAKLELLEEPGQLELHLFRRAQERRRTCGSRSSGTASR